jgi:hypothetical protein
VLIIHAVKGLEEGDILSVEGCASLTWPMVIANKRDHAIVTT